MPSTDPQRRRTRRRAACGAHTRSATGPNTDHARHRRIHEAAQSRLLSGLQRGAASGPRGPREGVCAYPGELDCRAPVADLASRISPTSATTVWLGASWGPQRALPTAHSRCTTLGTRMPARDMNAGRYMSAAPRRECGSRHDPLSLSPVLPQLRASGLGSQDGPNHERPGNTLRQVG